jgi:phenylacetate-coenzyme A ligase PaaK-like adenylate-forming protein
MSLYYLAKQIYQVKADSKLSPEEIKRLQKDRFERLVSHALTNSVFYKNYYKKYGITLDNFKQVGRKDFPIVDKKIIMENFDDVMCDKRLTKESLLRFIEDKNNRGKKYFGNTIIHTSGSTGDVGIFVYDPFGWATVKALAISRVSKNPIRLFKKTKLAFVGAIDGNFAGITLAIDAPKQLFELLAISANNPVQEILKKLNDFQPESISGYASSVNFLAQFQIAGSLHISPRRIICSGDPLTPTIRENVKKAFGILPVNFYAASESLSMAVEDEKHPGLSLFNDQVVFDFVDKNNQSVEYGTPGNVVITNLYNYVMPIIRYKMNDQLIVDPESCKENLPLYIKQIDGRQEDFLWFKRKDGTSDFVHPMITGLHIPGVDVMQIMQTGEQEITVRIVLSHGADKNQTITNTKDCIFKALREKHLHDEVGISVDVLDNIPFDAKTGKFKAVIKG